MKRLVNEAFNETDNEGEINGYESKLSSMHPSIVNWIGDYTDQLIIIVTEEGTVKFATKNVLQRLNYEPKEIIGKNISSFIYKSDIVKINELLKNSKFKRINYSLNFITDERKSLLFQITIKFMRLESKGFYICCLEDLVKEQQIEEMIIRAEKLSIAGQVAAGLAHEIRNPLTSLKGFIQLLQAGVEQKETYYKILLNEINKIEAITSELLFIAKPLTYHKQKESINKLIQEVIILLEPQAKLREVSLCWEDQQEIAILCNATHMKQVLINLIKNAIEASKKSNKVTIKVHEKLNEVIIDVIDEGEGIPKEFIHKLEEPFFTTKEDGTGLGLMITKNLLDYHDAKLKIIPQENKGTTFRIVMPHKQNS